GAGLTNAVTLDLKYDAADDVLVAAQYGRGAWLLSDASHVLEGAQITIVSGANGTGTLDSALAANNGVIVVATGDAPATLSTGALQAAGASHFTDITAARTLNFEDFGTLNVANGASFTTSTGVISFANVANTLSSPLAITFSAGSDLTVAKLN